MSRSKPISQILLQLENLGATMNVMLEDHTQLQVCAHLLVHPPFVPGQRCRGSPNRYRARDVPLVLAYDHLIIEMDRWSHYQNQMKSLVHEMAAQLQALRTGRFTLVLIFFCVPPIY